LEKAGLRQIIGGIRLKKNGGFTIVELIVVMACFGLVALFFWTMLSSSSEDTYTLTEKVEVQTSVTSLMNIIQKDIQEAKIVNLSAEKGIVRVSGDNYNFNNGGIVYTFEASKRTVTRTEGSSVSKYDDIIVFSMNPIKGEKYGAEVKIIGGKKPINTDELDKSRYELRSTYYTRNTI